MGTANVHEFTPTWKPSFALPYESDWSIREKFSFMNAVARSTLRLRDIDKLRDSTADSIPFLDQLKRLDLSQYIERHLVRVCPECIKYGYHSRIHQLLVYDNCFVHKDKNLITTNIYFQPDSCVPNYYETNQTTNAKNIVDNGDLLIEINKVSRKFTDNEIIQHINFNYENRRNNVIFNSTKSFLRSRIFSQTSNVDGVRTVLSVAKNDIPTVNKKAIKELSDKYPLAYFNELAVRGKLENRYTGAYMKMLIDDFISSEFNSENEYCHEVSIMDARKDYGKYRKNSKINRYAKVITITHIINSREPDFYHKLLSEWHYPPLECQRPINIVGELSRLENNFCFVSERTASLTAPMAFIQALLKDVFEDTSRRLVTKIQSGEFDIFDDMMIGRDNFYIPASQYILVDEIDKVTLYACRPD